MVALGGLAAWALVNGILVFKGYADLAFVSLALGLVGAAAVVSVSALMAKSDVFSTLRYAGEHSIVVYLSFFLGMAASRTVLIKSGLIADVGMVALIVTVSGVAGAVALFRAVRNNALRFLFERPAWARLETAPRVRLQPAE